ncbi:MAG TPA: ABC transporter permease [Acidimicrobiales bacterium]|nr:ABC transporter permease [Acidimicrobiales bacterium]
MLPALRTTEHLWRAYRRTWRGTVMTTFLNPVLYLAALGVGLGRFVDRGHHAAVALGGASYLDFVGPGLLAVTAMQVAVGESTFPVMGAVKWQKTYAAMLATPQRVGDVLAGHVTWIAARVATAVAAYLAVVAAFGALHSPLAVLALPAGVLTGMAFSLPLVGYSVRLDTEQSFNVVYRLGMIPLFLFSATFFPLSSLPVGLRVVAYATPLWHGVDLCRTLADGTATWGRSLLHVAYLAGLAALGALSAARAYTGRLRT